jgi:membrane fusion protein (multidrug efflux system)
MKTITLKSFIAIAMCMSVFTSCKKNQATQQNSTYPTMTVSREDKTVDAKYSGTLKGCHDVDVYPRISGNITKICINEGSQVKKGQVLFVIDQAPYRAAVQQSAAQVASYEASLANSRSTYESKQKLFDQKVVSKFDLDQAKNNLLAAKASLMQAKADLTSARNNLSYTTITSPVNGVAGMISLRVGALVSSNMTSPLVTVSDDSKMQAYFSLTENQYLNYSRKISKEHSTYIPPVSLILNDGTAYNYTGKVDAISGIIDSSTGAITMRATFVNPKHELLSGANVTVVLPVEHKQCIVIPQTATYELQDKTFVYRVVNGKAKSTPITIMEISDGKNYIVESGLKPGDVIISDGAGLVTEGTEVKIKK